MTAGRVLADEHVPNAVLTVLDSLGHDVVRSKDQLGERVDDRFVLEFARAHDRVVITADKRFTVDDGDVYTDHAGVIYADQSVLKRRPADAAGGIDRILEAVPVDERAGTEFYLSQWLGAP